MQIVYGTEDGKVASGTPPEWSTKMYDAFIEAGADAQLFAHQGEKHSFIGEVGQWENDVRPGTWNIESNEVRAGIGVGAVYGGAQGTRASIVGVGDFACATTCCYCGAV